MYKPFLSMKILSKFAGIENVRISLIVLIGLVAISCDGLRKASVFSSEHIELDRHNQARTEANRKVLFSWDENIADNAKKHAEYLARTNQFVHANKPNTGENLFKGTEGMYTTGDMIDFWIQEKRNFKPGIFPNISQTGKINRVAHYTQIIWDYTESDNPRLGCGKATGNGYDVLVCQYFPAGNILNQRVSPVE